MPKFKNLEAGNRVVNTVDGPFAIGPGEEVTLEVSKEELNVANSTGWFEIDGKRGTPKNFSGRGVAKTPEVALADPNAPKVPQDDAEEAKARAEAAKAAADKKAAAEALLAKADRMSANDLKDAAEKVLGPENTPTTKAAVLDALQDAAKA